MNYSNYKTASDWDVEKWLKESPLNLTPYQVETMRASEMVRFAPFEFIKRRKRQTNLLIRLSLVLYPFVWIILFLGLPFTYLINGKWGYSEKVFGWYSQWTVNLGL